MSPIGATVLGVSLLRRTGAVLLLAGLVSLTGMPAAAAEDPAASPAPANYVIGLVGTTLAYQPHDGSWDGWQHDVTPLLGYGRQLTPTIALELDAGPTYVRGSYSSFSLTPGLVWSASTHVYLAARFIVPVDPEANFVLFPGIGLARPSGRFLSTLELNLSSAVGRGQPDLGVSLTAGFAVFF
jgi:hypothetical protein